jgi:hypothetical protein
VAVNLIVIAVTLLMAAYLGVWILCPRLRALMEMPKYRFQERQGQYPGLIRDPRPVSDETSERLSRNAN